MLKFDSITLRRGPNALLQDTSALIHASQRVAIIGANGAGKTSLFKLIRGELSVDAGEWHLSGQCRVAYMAQEVDASSQSARDFVLDGHAELRRLEARLSQAEQQQDDHAIAHAHGELEAIHAYEAPAQAEKLLHGLGFRQSEMERPVSDFSGGWRIRLNLAQALMCPSDLLLLDEPTNHLDLDAMLWLERWLKQYSGTLLFISHDRDFIDAVATHTIHIEQAKLNQYAGGYSSFERLRAQKLAQQQAQFEKQQQRVAEIHAFVSRFKAKATKAKQAQSRVKELERMELIAPAHVDSPFSFVFPSSDKISSPLLNLSACDLGYTQGSPVLRDFSMSILPGARIGLLGPNGAGKSTLVKSLTGTLDLLSGKRVPGEHLKIGYFAQHQLEALDYQASPLLHLQRISPKASDQEIRNFLGGFDFRGDKALDPITHFSGGEKARLVLAMIAFGKPNLLLLDEPTNHLDLEMRHALTVALQGFEGAVIVVSHDRHLLKNTVDQFCLVADGKVEEFRGDLADYERWLLDYQKLGATGVSGGEKPAVSTPGRESAEDKKERKRREAEARARLSPLKNALQKIEKDMQSVQATLEQLEADLSDASVYEERNKDALRQLLEQQATAKGRLDTLESEWFEIGEQIESIDPVDT